MDRNKRTWRDLRNRRYRLLSAIPNSLGMSKYKQPDSRNTTIISGKLDPMLPESTLIG